MESEETSPARDINFDPLVLPDGIAPSDDPLLSARSAIYSQSFTRRAGEKKEPSAITPAEVQKVSAKTTTERQQFTGLMRFLHWLMAAMVLTMLGIGVAMVASLGDYHSLVSIHRPLGIAILILVVIRLVNAALQHAASRFPATMSSQERLAAHASEVLLYTLLFVQPLVGWGMLSAARYPIVLFGSLHLFPILPHSVMLYAVLAEDAYDSGVPLLPRVHRPFWSDSVSHADRARRDARPHGAVASPRALAPTRLFAGVPSSRR